MAINNLHTSWSTVMTSFHIVCSNCLIQVVTLENASLNLAAFKSLARSFMEEALWPLKEQRRPEVRLMCHVTLSVRPQSIEDTKETPFFE